MDEPGPFSLSLSLPLLSPSCGSARASGALFKWRTPRLSYLPTADSLSVNDCLSRELSTGPTQPSPALYSVALADETGESKTLLAAVLGR